MRNTQKLAPATDTTTLFDDLEKYAGLRFSHVTIPADVVMVDAVNPCPTPNAPRVVDRLPREPDEFEVATIKLAGPDDQTRGASVRVDHGGRVQIVMA